MLGTVIPLTLLAFAMAFNERRKKSVPNDKKRVIGEDV